MEEMNEFTTTPTDMVGETDVMAKEMVERQIKSTQEEVEGYTQAVKHIQGDIDNYNEQWLVDKRLMELQLENFGKIPEHFTHNVHKLPEYWDLEKKAYSYQVREKTGQAEQFLKQRGMELESAKQKVIVASEQLAKLTKQLEELQ